MKTNYVVPIGILLISVLASCSSYTGNSKCGFGVGPEKTAVPENWATSCRPIAIDAINEKSAESIKLRAGYYPKAPAKKRINVLYLEGLADSMFNHDRMIEKLTEKNKYRVIAFDYPGQGGSEGNMDKTRIVPDSNMVLREITAQWKAKFSLEPIDKYLKPLQSKFPHFASTNQENPILIKTMVDRMWVELRSFQETEGKENIDPDNKGIQAVIGWSTGGLAAYEMAKSRRDGLEAVVLIAPGNNPKPVLEISADTLTSNSDFKHVEGIQPPSPGKVPYFAQNLLLSGFLSQDWKVKTEVKGLVLLSSPVKDVYVDSKKVCETIQENANHFELVVHENAKHEIDNESDANRKGKAIKNCSESWGGNDGILLEDRVLGFLDKVFDKD